MNTARHLPQRGAKRLAVLTVCALLPALMGGCSEFRNESVNAIEGAAQGILSAALNMFFDQFRTDDFV